jgi:pimeloyl-ACP methyl ester carboxylesterase
MRVQSSGSGRLKRWLKRGLLVLAAFWLLLIVVGLLYQTIATQSDNRNFSPPGQLVDIGTHSMHLYCSGEGSPTVILDAGAGLWSVAWTRVQPELSTTTRVCSFDRSGLGWSDMGSVPYDGLQAAHELHALLEAADVAGPYIYVGHSLSGMFARVYYDQFPEGIAGMVLIDPGDPGLLVEELGKEEGAAINPCGWKCSLASLVARLGVVRFSLGKIDLLVDSALPSQAVAEWKARMALPRSAVFMLTRGRYLPVICYQTLKNRTLGDIHLSLVYSGEFGSLLASSEDEQERIDWLQSNLEAWTQTVALSTRGTGPHPIAGANHLSIVLYEEYADQVVDKIDDVIDLVREDL